LSDKYYLQEFPEILVFDREGELISKGAEVTRFFFEPTPSDALVRVSRFPWPQMFFKDAALTCTFRKEDNSVVSFETLKKSGVVAFLYSTVGDYDDSVAEKGRPLSKDVAKKLKGIYEELQKAGKSFEVVWVPMDPPSDWEQADTIAKGGNRFDLYRKAVQMPASWLHVGDLKKPSVFYEDPNIEAANMAEAIAAGPNHSAFDLSDDGPVLHMVQFEGDAPLTVLNPQATCQMLREGAKGFPWKESLVRDLTMALDDDPKCLERSPFVLTWIPRLTVAGAAARKAIQDQVLKTAEAEEARGDLAFYTTEHQEIAEGLLDTVGILANGEVAGDFEGSPFAIERKKWFGEDKAFVLAFDMGDFPCGYASEVDYCKEEVDVAAFVASYRTGELKPQKIEQMSPEEIALQIEMAENDEQDDEEVELGSEDTDDE